MKTRLLVAALGAALGCATSAALAADPVNGKLIYTTGKNGTMACSACHGSDPNQNQMNIKNGSNWTVIKSAIGSVSLMSQYASVLTDTDLQDIAAFITDPTSATPTPKAALAPTSINFGNQTINIASNAQTASFTNSGTAPLTLQSITLSGANASDYTRGGTCAANAVLNPGTGCTIDVTFTPLAVGTRNASVSITHNAGGSPTALALTGAGVSSVTLAPAITFTPTTLAFGSQVLGATTTAKTVQLANTGTAALSLTGLQLAGTNPGDFAQTSDCPLPGALAVGASCTISVTFTPTSAGARGATLTAASNATGTPQVALSGTGTTPTTPTNALTLAPMSIDFGSRRVGMTSAPRKVQVVNTGTVNVTISAISVTGDYVQVNNCTGAALAPAGSCAVTLRFKPTAVGARAGDLAITSTVTGSPHHVALTGNGLAPRTKGSAAAPELECETEDDASGCSATVSPLGTMPSKGR